MHQTTIRFDSELWRRIDEESRRIGVSAAQYIRDSALIRLTSEAYGSSPASVREPAAAPVPTAATVAAPVLAAPGPAANPAPAAAVAAAAAAAAT